MKITELLTERVEKSISKDLNPITHSGRKTYYLVQDPMSAHAEAGDVIAQVDGNSFAHIFIGAGHGKVAGKENWVLYREHEKEKALKDANDRLMKKGSDYFVTEAMI